MGGVVIVGGGIAAITTAQELRRHGYAEPVVVLGEEDVVPYDRPGLSKSLVDSDAQTIADPSSLAHNDIELITGVEVEALTPEGAQAGGRTFAGSHYVLATGAEAVLPTSIPALPNVHTLRTADDARWLRLDLDGAQDVVLVGGGLVNSEIASVLCNLGSARVHVVDPVRVPLVRVLGQEVGLELHRRMSAAGVVHWQGSVSAVEMTSRSLLAYVGTETRLRADCMVVGVGARPRVDLAVRAGAAVGDGVLCDEFGRTSLPNVYAVGDVANWPYGRFGLLRAGHWKSAVDQAAVVARTIAGVSAPSSDMVPWFWTEQFGARVEVAGVLRPGGHEQVIRSAPDAVEVVVEASNGEVEAVIGMNAFQACRRFRQGQQWETVA